MALIPEGPAPYTSVAAATLAIEKFRERGLGVPITPEVLIRAGVSESIASRTLQSLKLLELVEEDGRPSERFTEMKVARSPDDFKELTQTWLKDVYAEVLGYSDPSTDSFDKIVDAFRGYQPPRQRRAMASLLVGLWKFAGLPGAQGSTPPRNTERRSSSRKLSDANRASTKNSRPLAGLGQKEDFGTTLNTDDLSPAILGLVHQIPRGGESWTKQRRDAFIAAFEGVLDFSVPNREGSELETGKSDLPMDS